MLNICFILHLQNLIIVLVKLLLIFVPGYISQYSAPLSVTKVADTDIFRFFGDKSIPLNFQSVVYVDKWYDNATGILLLSGQDYIFMLNATQNKELLSNGEVQCIEKLKWASDNEHYSSCRKKGKNEYHCRNYIRVVELLHDQRLYVCGTNAYRPICRYYKRSQFQSLPHQNSLYDEEVACNQQCECPFNPYTSSAVLYTNKTANGPHIFASVINDYRSTNHILLRKRMADWEEFIATEPNWLNKPTFLKLIEYGDKVYLFFQERASAVETGTGSSAIYARVAQVCANDIVTDSRILRNQWSSFVKARLQCTLKSTSGSELDFNNLTSVSEITKMAIKPGGVVEDVIFATFSTPWEWDAVQFSAVCVFSLKDDIQNLFETGKFFKEESVSETMHMRAAPISPSLVPSPRLGTCTNLTQDDDAMFFAKTNHLLYDTITTFAKQPIYVSEQETHMTQVTIDENAGQTGNLLLYIGTEDARLLRLRPVSYMEKSIRLVLLEERLLISKASCYQGASNCTIHALKILPQKSHQSQPLAFVAFTDHVEYVILTSCSQYITLECCNFDPDCAWHNSNCKVRYSLVGKDVPSVSSASSVPSTCVANGGTKNVVGTKNTTPTGAGIGIFIVGFFVGILFVLAILLVRQRCTMTQNTNNLSPSDILSALPLDESKAVEINNEEYTQTKFSATEPS